MFNCSCIMFNIALNHVQVCIVSNIRTRNLREWPMSLYPDLNRTLTSISLFFNALDLGDVYTLRWIGSSLHFSEWLGVLTPCHSLKHQHVTEEICHLNQSTIFISSRIHCIEDAWKYMENLLCIFVLFFCKYYAFWLIFHLTKWRKLCRCQI